MLLVCYQTKWTSQNGFSVNYKILYQDCHYLLSINLLYDHTLIVVTLSMIKLLTIHFITSSKWYNNAVLAITSVKRDTSKEKNYQKLNLETLRQRRWYMKLCYMFKLLRNQSLRYLFKILPTENRCYCLRNSGNLPTLKLKHNF